MTIFRAPTADEDDLAVIALIEDLRRRLAYVTLQKPAHWTGVLRRNTQARNIQASNSIEGFHASVEDVHAIAASAPPGEASVETQRAIAGYQRALSCILALADGGSVTVSAELFRSLHFMMVEREGDSGPGKFRRAPVYVIRAPEGETVYEGPDAADVPALVAELAGDLNARSGLPVMMRAAMAHLNLTMIHPFRDGNGRMARALQTLILARDGTVSPEFASIEEWLGRNTPAYYEILAAVGQGRWNPDRSAHPWVKFCLSAHYEQARRIELRDAFFGRVWVKIEALLKQSRINPRLTGLLMDAALGYRVTAGHYRAETDVSDVIASRDLRHLCDSGLLAPKGEKRGRHYVASPSLRALALANERREPINKAYDLVARRRAEAENPRLPLD